MQLVTLAAKHGGKLFPLPASNSLTRGRALLNPSITQLSNKQFLIFARLTNFMLPVEFSAATRAHKQMLIDENRTHFQSEAIALILNDRLEIVAESKVEFSPTESKWIYQGLEDLRITTWNNRFYASGTRRDYQSDGRGRIEILEFENDSRNSTWKEVSKSIPIASSLENSFLEKNWVPVSDKPFTYVRWTIPTEVLKLKDWDSGQSEIDTHSKNIYQYVPELRGGTELVRWGDGYLSFVHQSVPQQSYLGCVSLTYQHRLVVWSEDLKIQQVSDKPFGVMFGKVEFLSGLATYNGGLLLTFGYQDSCACLLELPKSAVDELIQESIGEES